MTQVVFVLHTANLKGGAENSVLELIKDTVKKHKVTVITPGQGELSMMLQNIGAEVESVRFYYWDRNSDEESLVNQEAIASIYAIIKTVNPVCVITNTLMIPWGAIAASYANVPHIWLAREMLVHRNQHMEINYKFIEAYSNLIMANSKSNAEYIKHITGSKNVGQFYSYVDPDKLSIGKSSKEIRIVSIASRIHRDKNQLEIIKAINELKSRASFENKVILIGARSDDEYNQEIDTFIHKNKLSKQITFAGYVEHPYKLVGPADILVQPSLHESLGRVITEAMLLGILSIGADIPANKEAFRIGFGILYKAGDNVDLADKISSTISNHGELSRKAQSHKSQVRGLLSRDVCNMPVLEAITTVAGKPSPRSENSSLVAHLLGLSSGHQSVFARTENYRKIAINHRDFAKQKESELNKITASRVWKVVNARKKLQTKFIHSSQSKRKDTVHFVYSEEYKNYGTTVMRGHQLSEIAKTVLAKEYYVKYSSTDTPFKNSVLFLTKWAAITLKEKGLLALKDNKNTLIVDMVDGGVPDYIRRQADIVVAVSQSAYNHYTEKLKLENIVLVDHHPDPRVSRQDWSTAPVSFSCAYFGEPSNTFITPSIENEVDVIKVSTSIQDTGWLGKLPKYNMHYAIREHNEKYPTKPFLKGFMAAHCHSNILVHHSDNEAIRWLGDDYPYIMKKSINEKNILEMIQYAQRSYGSAEWLAGLATMERIRQSTAPSHYEEQLKKLFDSIGHQGAFTKGQKR